MPEQLHKAEGLNGAIERERARLLGALDALEGRATTLALTPEGWTATDVLAHLIHYAGQVAWGLGAKMQPPAYVMANAQRRPTGDQWNAFAVEHYRSQPSGTVRAEFERNVAALLERTRMLSDQQLSADTRSLVAWAGPGPLWQFIADDTCLHWALHTSGIADAKERTR